MKTSVVMATYNGSEFIREQLDSIKNQTMHVDEVVICDDRSKDDTVEIVRSFIADNSLQGWNIEVNEVNLGYGSNFNKALLKASGDYIFFSDQDDIWEPDKVETMVRIMEENSDIKLLCSEFEIFCTGGEKPENTGNWDGRNLCDRSLEKINLNAHNIFIGSLGCDMCIRGSFAKQIAPYWFTGWAQDEYVWKMAQCAEGCYIYHFPLIRHRVHAHNVSMHKIHDINKRIRFLEDLKKGNEACRKFVADTTGNREYIRLIDKNIKSEAMRIDLLKNCKVLNTIPLLFYGKYYHSRKSLLMEPWIALKQRKLLKNRG